MLSNKDKSSKNNAAWERLAQSSLLGPVLNSYIPSSIPLMTSFKMNPEPIEPGHLKHTIIETLVATPLKFAKKYGIKLYGAATGVNAIETAMNASHRYTDNINAGMPPIASGVCSSLATAGQYATNVVGGAATMKIAFPLALGGQYYIAAAVAHAGIFFTHATSHAVGNAIQSTCEVAHEKILEKETLFNGLRTLNKIEEKEQVKPASFGEAAIKLGSIIALREALQTQNSTTASKLFLDAVWVDNQNLSVTKALANIPGVECSYQDQTLIRKITTPVEKANAAAEICSFTRNSTQTYRRKY